MGLKDSMMVRRLIIFASFSGGDDIPPYILYHLKALKEFGDKLVFVSNSPLGTKAWQQLGPICDDVLERANVGYDFAAWRDAIQREDMGQWDEVLLTNSSVVGPLFSLSSVFQDMQVRDCDFWGLTHSINTRPHIQSYFVCFRRVVLESHAWRSFWQKIEDTDDKWLVIRNYEVQFKGYFEASGFQGDTLIPQMKKSGVERIGVRRSNICLPIYVPIDKNRTNPTIHSPLELIESGLPYLKASLLWGHNRRQPFPLKKIMALEKVDYDWSLVGL